jgi:hypothetical protein
MAPSERASVDLIQAWIYSLRGQHNEAQTLLRQVEHSALVENSLDFQLWLAEGWALENQPALALPILSRVAKAHPNYPWFGRNPNLQSLRGNPDFGKLMTDLKNDWENNRTKYQKAASLLSENKVSPSSYRLFTWPAAAMYNRDSFIPSIPSSRSMSESANAAVQNDARLSAVAVSNTVWQKWPASR